MQSYLAAKRTVDDRALNRRVLERFEAALAARDRPVRILELGAGIGTMPVRLAEWDCLPDRVCYRAVDRDEDSIARARERVPDGLERTGYTVDRGDSSALVATRERRGARQRLEITFDVADAFEIWDRADAVIAAAFLDLVDLPDALAGVDDLLAADGLLYAPITFDGGTVFAPAHPLDERVERRYHRHMDEVRDDGSSRAGRELLVTLPDRGWDVLATGRSDWVVRPRSGDENESQNENESENQSQSYHAEEQLVLAYVLETVDGALADAPDAPNPSLSTEAKRRWLDRRRRELERGDLAFVAHNLDVLARRP